MRPVERIFLLASSGTGKSFWHKQGLVIDGDELFDWPHKRADAKGKTPWWEIPELKKQTGLEQLETFGSYWDKMDPYVPVTFAPVYPKEFLTLAIEKGVTIAFVGVTLDVLKHNVEDRLASYQRRGYAQAAQPVDPDKMKKSTDWYMQAFLSVPHTTELFRKNQDRIGALHFVRALFWRQVSSRSGKDDARGN